MRDITRRGVVAGTGAAAGLGLFSIGAKAATFEYKFANNAPDTHPLNVRMREAMAAILAESNGQLKISVFPNNQLGSDTDMLSQLRAGAIQFFTLSGLILSTLVPVASINGVGFAFPDYKTVWAAMDGKLGAYVRAAIAQHDLYAMKHILDNGFRQISSSTHPIATPADLQGFKIRVPVSPLWTSLFTDFGASPISININEVYSALQTKIADGQENALTLIDVSKFYEVQKYVSMTSHMWDGFWFLANGAAWKRLPPNLSAIAEKHINAAALLEREDLAKLGTSEVGTLQGKGMVFNYPDKPPFRAKLQSAGFYKDWHRKYGDAAWSLLEEYCGKLS